MQRNRPQFSHLKDYTTNTVEHSSLAGIPAALWEDKGKKMAFDLFKYSYTTVPAYKKFIDSRKKGDIKQFSRTNFSSIPAVTKKDYLRAYPYETLFPYKDITVATTISATSGSTGEPFFFPRGEAQDKYYESILEILLERQFSLSKKKTLVVIGFALGIWIGGIFTYKNLNQLAQKHGNLSVIPVGTNKELFLKSVAQFARAYDQVILMGYPPFMKDVLEEGGKYGIVWKDHSIKILTAAEGYSEHFRTHIAGLAGIKNMMNDIVNIYGTVEQGTIAHETTLANTVRNLATKDPSLFKSLFGETKTVPTFAQYYPDVVYFEEAGGQILATSYGSSIPLVRYKFADLGGVIPYEKMRATLKAHGYDLKKEFSKYSTIPPLELPFVFIYARSDFAIVFRGANIYPEEIRHVLNDRALSGFVTGRCTIEKKEDKKLNQELVVHVELKQGVRGDSKIKALVLEMLVSGLSAANSEYRNEYLSDKKRATPTVVLHPYNHPTHFSHLGKQRWVK